MNIKWTQVRGYIGVVVAIATLAVFASALTVYMEYDIPGLTDLAEFLGIDKLKGM